MSARKRGPLDHTELPVTYPEVNNPAMSSALEHGGPKHPFEGDEHGHDRHDTVPAEEEWDEDEMQPSRAHNPEADDSASEG